MASEFAVRLYDRLRPIFLSNRAIRSLVLTAIDGELLKVAEALGHARHRTHLYDPGGCSGCEKVEKVAERLRIN